MIAATTRRVRKCACELGISEAKLGNLRSTIKIQKTEATAEDIVRETAQPLLTHIKKEGRKYSRRPGTVGVIVRLINPIRFPGTEWLLLIHC